MTPEQVCNFLGVTRSWLYDKTSRKKIPFYKVGQHVRFKRSEIAAWLDL